MTTLQDKIARLKKSPNNSPEPTGVSKDNGIIIPQESAPRKTSGGSSVKSLPNTPGSKKSFSKDMFQRSDTDMMNHRTPKTPTSPRKTNVSIFIEKEERKDKRTSDRKSAPLINQEDIQRGKNQLTSKHKRTNSSSKRKSNIAEILFKNLFKSPEEEEEEQAEEPKEFQKVELKKTDTELIGSNNSNKKNERKEKVKSSRSSRRIFFSPEEEEDTTSPQQQKQKNESEESEFLSVLGQIKHKRLLQLKKNTEELSEAFEENTIDREEFRKYAEDRSIPEEFKFFEIYQLYQKEKNKKQKQKYEKQLISQINGKNYFTEKLNKKFEQEKEKLKDLSLIYEDVYITLNPIFQEFLKKKKKEETFTPIREQLQQQKISIPNSFEELIIEKQVYELFSLYVSDHYGLDYISCFDDLIKYKSDPTAELKKKIMKYCKIDSNECVLYNIDIRNSIIQKDTLQKGWDKELYSLMFRILSEEYYPRFIFSQLWKDYLKASIVKFKNQKFTDSYSVLKVVEKVEKISQVIEVCSVWNNVTSEPFSAKRIYSSSLDVKQETIKYLNHIQNSNIIQFVEVFSEDVLSKQNCLTIVTSEINENLEKYLESFDDHLSPLEMANLMKQILLAVEEFHKKSKNFDFGKLTEKNIYVSIDGRIYVDPGFYTDIDKKYPEYFLPPEAIVSNKSDIYAVGMICFKLITLLKQDQIEKLCENQTSAKSIKDIFKQTPAYFTNMKKELISTKIYDEKLISLIIQMIDPNPSHRPDVTEILKELQKLMVKLISRCQICRSQRYQSLSQNQIIVLQDDVCRRFFKEYLRTELSTECILFFEDVQIFTKLESDKERFSKAEEICQSYLLPTSPLEINISGKLQKGFSQELIEAKQIGDIKIDIFEDVLKHVTDTVILDSFPRFHASKMKEDLDNYPLFSKR